MTDGNESRVGVACIQMQPEIGAYLKRCATDFDVRRHLHTECDRTLTFGKERTEYGHTDERDHVRPIAQHFSAQRDTTSHELVGRQRVDSRRGARNDVRDAIAPFRQPHIVLITDALGNETGFVEQLPEAIGEAGEVVARQRGPDARVDADKQHLDTRLDSVAQRREGKRQRALWTLSIGH